jgi:hypothetical protein
VVFGEDPKLRDTRFLRLALWSFCAFLVLLLLSRLDPPRVLVVPLDAGLFVTAAVAFIAAYVWIWTMLHSIGKGR